MHVRSTTALQSDINVTPLVDVCLVLLITFMVVLPTLVVGMPVKSGLVDFMPRPDSRLAQKLRRVTMTGATPRGS